MALPLMNVTRLEERAFALSQRANVALPEERHSRQRMEKPLKGTWRGRENKTAQDKMPVADRPRVKAAKRNG